ncbi:hypothetical protein PIB30_096103, partial [Stylosanthes scabra]|nr:hypothetical protein [Stylosanthes scabra]
MTSLNLSFQLVHNAKPPSPKHIGGCVMSYLNLRLLPHFSNKWALGQAVEDRFSNDIASRTGINNRRDSVIEGERTGSTIHIN